MGCAPSKKQAPDPPQQAARQPNVPIAPPPAAGEPARTARPGKLTRKATGFARSSETGNDMDSLDLDFGDTVDDVPDSARARRRGPAMSDSQKDALSSWSSSRSSKTTVRRSSVPINAYASEPSASQSQPPAMKPAAPLERHSLVPRQSKSAALDKAKLRSQKISAASGPAKGKSAAATITPEASAGGSAGPPSGKGKAVAKSAESSATKIGRVNTTERFASQLGTTTAGGASQSTKAEIQRKPAMIQGGTRRPQPVRGCMVPADDRGSSARDRTVFFIVEGQKMGARFQPPELWSEPPPMPIMFFDDESEDEGLHTIGLDDDECVHLELNEDEETARKREKQREKKWQSMTPEERAQEDAADERRSHKRSDASEYQQKIASRGQKKADAIAKWQKRLMYFKAISEQSKLPGEKKNALRKLKEATAALQKLGY